MTTSLVTGKHKGQIGKPSRTTSLPSGRRKAFSRRLSDLPERNGHGHQATPPHITNPWMSSARPKRSLNSKYEQSIVFPRRARIISQDAQAELARRQREVERVERAGRIMMKDEERGSEDGSGATWYPSLPPALTRQTGVSEKRAKWLDALFDNRPSEQQDEMLIPAYPHIPSQHRSLPVGPTRPSPVSQHMHQPAFDYRFGSPQLSTQYPVNIFSSTPPFASYWHSSRDTMTFTPDATSTPQSVGPRMSPQGRPFAARIQPQASQRAPEPLVHGILKDSFVEPFYPHRHSTVLRSEGMIPNRNQSVTGGPLRVRFDHPPKLRFSPPIWSSSHPASSPLGHIATLASVTYEVQKAFEPHTVCDDVRNVSYPAVPKEMKTLPRRIPTPLTLAFQDIVNGRKRMYALPISKDVHALKSPRLEEAAAQPQFTEESEELSARSQKEIDQMIDEVELLDNIPQLSYFTDRNQLPPSRQNGLVRYFQAPTSPSSTEDAYLPLPSTPKVMKVTEGAWADYDIPPKVQARLSKIDDKKRSRSKANRRDHIKSQTTQASEVAMQPSQCMSEVSSISGFSADSGGQSADSAASKEKEEIAAEVDEDELQSFGLSPIKEEEEQSENVTVSEKCGKQNQKEEGLTYTRQDEVEVHDLEKAFGPGFFGTGGDLGFKIWRDGYC